MRLILSINWLSRIYCEKLKNSWTVLLIGIVPQWKRSALHHCMPVQNLSRVQGLLAKLLQNFFKICFYFFFLVLKIDLFFFILHLKIKKEKKGLKIFTIFGSSYIYFLKIVSALYAIQYDLCLTLCRPRHNASRNKVSPVRQIFLL